VDIGELRGLYEDKGEEIFDDSWLDDLVDLGKFAGADYDNRKLKREIKRVLGNATLGDLRKRVLVTAFDLDNEDPVESKRTWKPKLFHNFPGDGSDSGELAYKVGLYTSAAPTYFPSADGYVDGGVYATNPSMCALAQSQDTRYMANPSVSDVLLLSLGTGTSLVYIPGSVHDWGYAQWAKPLVNLMLDGTAGIADYQCKQILKDRYHRLAPIFPPGTSIPMDGVDRIPYMVDFATNLDLAATVQWLQNHWM
jgi:uncharacterized protein